MSQPFKVPLAQLPAVPYLSFPHLLFKVTVSHVTSHGHIFPPHGLHPLLRPSLSLLPSQGVFGRQRSSLAEKLQGSTAAASGTAAASTRYPVLLRRLVKSLPLFDPQQMAALGKNTYGGPLLQAMLRASAADQ